MAVGVKVQAQRVGTVACVGVLLQEAGGRGIVHPRVEVVKPRFLVVLVPGVQDAVVRRTRGFQHDAERVVIVGGGDRACRGVDQGCYVGVAVVEVVVLLGPNYSFDKVRAVDVARGLSIIFINEIHPIFFVQFSYPKGLGATNGCIPIILHFLFFDVPPRQSTQGQAKMLGTGQHPLVSTAYIHYCGTLYSFWKS